MHVLPSVQTLSFQGISIAAIEWLTHVDGVPAIVLFLLAFLGDTLKGSLEITSNPTGKFASTHEHGLIFCEDSLNTLLTVSPSQEFIGCNWFIVIFQSQWRKWRKISGKVPRILKKELTFGGT